MPGESLEQPKNKLEKFEKEVEKAYKVLVKANQAKKLILKNKKASPQKKAEALVKISKILETDVINVLETWRPHIPEYTADIDKVLKLLRQKRARFLNKADEFTESPLKFKAAKSPTGQPLQMNTPNYERYPDLQAQPPRYIVFLKGDGQGDHLNSLGTLDRVRELRREGHNIVVVAPALNPDEQVSRDDKWDYFKENPELFDKMMNFCKTQAEDTNSDTPRIDLLSYSGGYRAVASFLQSPEHSASIRSITALDSTFLDSDDPFVEEAIKFVKNGGHLQAITSTPKDGIGRQTRKATAELESKLPNNPNLEIIDTLDSHSDSAKNNLESSLRKILELGS